MTAWLVGIGIFQLGHWPALTKLTLGADGGLFRLRHWPPLESEAFGLPSLAELEVFVQSDATGLLQLEHTILGLMLNTSALWHRSHDKYHRFESMTPTRGFMAKRCPISQTRNSYKASSG